MKDNYSVIGWKALEEVSSRRQELLDSMGNCYAKRAICLSLEKVPCMESVVIINGTGSSGKSTFVSYCRNISQDIGFFLGESPDAIRIEEFSSIDPVRYAVQHNIIGDVEKDEAYRLFLTRIKDAWREYDENGPTNDIMRRIDPLVKINDPNRLYSGNSDLVRVIFVHVREPEEIERLREKINRRYNGNLPVTTLLIDGRVDPKSHLSPSDRGVEKFDYDLVIHNSGDRYELLQSAELFLSDHVSGILKNACKDIINGIRIYKEKMECPDTIHSEYSNDSIE